MADTATKLSSDGHRVRLFAIEMDPSNFAALQSNLADFDAERAGRFPVAYLRRGTLASHTEEVFRLVGQGPAFVFLDPCGADGLSLAFVHRVLALEKGEVFALFSHHSIHRHLSTLAAEYHVRRTRREVAESLFPDLEDEWLEQAMERAEEADASLRPTKEAAERILIDLFGSPERVREILSLVPTHGPNEVLRAYIDELKTCGASHITRIAVFDDEQKHAYWLIHAAKNAKAAVKMKEAAHSAINKSSLPETSKRWIRFAHAARVDDVVAAVKERFAGQEVRWTDEAKSTNTVLSYALGETPMAMDQAEDLKRRLRSPLPVTCQRPLTFHFPAKR